MESSSTTGTVYLVGAGPGDPGLVTLAAVECIRKADVVLYDYLANSRLLEYARPGATTICMGRHGKERIWSQGEINAALVRHARNGQIVVRLKGGDPAVFARGAEEAEVLAKEGIPFQIIPGITAALAAGSCAGIPVTHRDMASAVALVTGQERPGKKGSLDYEALARFPGTLVFYMGVTNAPSWTSALVEAGKPMNTPAAIIRRCSFPDQQVITCRLDEVASAVKQQGIRPPVIVIVGPVVSLAATLSWFDRRPLFGQTVVITRPRHQCSSLRDPLEALGAEVLVQPAIEIVGPPDEAMVDRMLGEVNEFDWLVFTSSNGVRFTLDRLLQAGYDTRKLGNVQLACVGPGTAGELARYYLQCDAMPEVYEAAALGDNLAESARGKRFLVARASRGRDILARKLAAAGGHVKEFVAYTSRDVTDPDPALQERLAAGGIDWITVTSSAIANSLVNMFGDQLQATKLVSISPITTATLLDRGHPPTVAATEYTMPGVVQAIQNYAAKNTN